MPQVFMAVRCYACNVFQVQQVKKAPKWVCKMCGEKQSLKKEYGRGSGADCRRHVQKLNMMKASMDNLPDHDADRTGRPLERFDMNEMQDAEQEEHLPPQGQQSTSVWNQFVDNTEEVQTIPDEPHLQPSFDMSKVTTDRDMFQGRRGAGRSKGRGKGNQYTARKRKFDQDEPHDMPDPNQTYSNPRPPDEGQSLHGQRQFNKHTKTVDEGGMSSHAFGKRASMAKNTAPFSGKSAASMPSTQTSGKWGQFLHTGSHNDMEQPTHTNSSTHASKMSSPKSGNTKWGQFLEYDDPAETDNTSSQEICSEANKKQSESTISSNNNSKWGQFAVDTERNQENTSDINQKQPKNSSNTNSEWGQFTVETECNQENTSESNQKQPTISSSVNSKWGQFLEDDSVPESCGDVDDNSLPFEPYQHDSSTSSSQRDWESLNNDQVQAKNPTGICHGHDENHSINASKNLGKCSKSTTIDQQKEALQSSNQLNLCPQTNKAINQRNLKTDNQNNNSKVLEHACRQKQAGKVDNPIFTIDENHLDELYSDDW